MGGRVDELASIAEAQAVAAATKRVLICFVIYFIFRGRPEKRKKNVPIYLWEKRASIFIGKKKKKQPNTQAPPTPIYTYLYAFMVAEVVCQ